MSLTMQEIISQMTEENIKRREHFNKCFKIYEDNPRSFGYMEQVEIAVITTEMRNAKQYMREQENLLEHIKLAQQKSVTETAQVILAATTASIEQTWANEVDRQGGSFTAEELDPNRG